MQNLNLKLLSEALGEVARGFKKLKLVVDGVLNSGQVVPGEDENLPVETGEDQEMFGTTCPETTIEPVSAPSCAKYLLKSKFGVAKRLQQELFDHVLKKTVRCDRFGNQWILDAESKRGWRKMNAIQLEQFRQHLKRFHYTVLQFTSRDDFVKEFGNIRQSKWSRFNNFGLCDFSKNVFRKMCVEVHHSLPSLR